MVKLLPAPHTVRTAQQCAAFDERALKHYDSKGDHILAARFLNRFVPPAINWVHLDLAASHRSGGLGHIASDFTEFGVRYATHLLLEQDCRVSAARRRRCCRPKYRPRTAPGAVPTGNLPRDDAYTHAPATR